MEQSLICRVRELFPGSVIVNNSAFKARLSRGKCAHFAADFVNMARRAGLTWDNCAHFQKDCFESLSPSTRAA